MVPAAPNPSKVMLYIAERKQAGVDMGIEQVIVNTLKGAQRSPEHLTRNPFGSLPVLEFDDGSYLLESRSIIGYLEEKFPQGAMISGTIEERALACDLERIVEMRVALPMSRYVHATNSPLGLPQDPKVAAEIEQSLPVALQWLEEKLADGRGLLSGENVTIADCTLQAGLQFARFGKVDLIKDYPGLRSWDARYRTRPAALEVLKF